MRLGDLDPGKACDESLTQLLAAKPLFQLWPCPEAITQPGGYPLLSEHCMGRSGFGPIVGDSVAPHFCPRAGIAIHPRLKPQSVPGEHRPKDGMAFLGNPSLQVPHVVRSRSREWGGLP